ncbi:MAG: 5'/3'-nucleotidase SurE [Desulfobacula sp.]|nr:5'/3'-nucleotidase SurE [Desulfobacula sp.]
MFGTAVLIKIKKYICFKKIEDVKLVKPAQAFSQIAETWVVAPDQDRSGTTHYISVYRKHVLNAEKVSIGDNIRAYKVDGYPADCILLALKGIMKDNPPDLVISGINGGPNLGYDWLASGTIGAARIASYWGVPAIAVSGMKEEIPGASDSCINWVIKLAQSELIQKLKPKQYLTISIPRIPPGKIKGIKVAERAGILLDFKFNFVPNKTDSSYNENWYLQRPTPVTSVEEDRDAKLYRDDYIILVPMLADEHDDILLQYLIQNPALLPTWNTNN